MKEYHDYVGIDIGKFNFVVTSLGKKSTCEYENNEAGIEKFLSDYSEILPSSLCVLETTGGYETLLLYTLCDKKIAVHRANTRKVKNFIRSFGNDAKTDALDAKALAKYGAERFKELDLFQPKDKKRIALFQLAQRRKDLTKMLVAEENRFQSPSAKFIKKSCKDLIKNLKQQISKITDEIENIISSDPGLKKRREILKSIYGIGNITSLELIILLPELGKINRKKIASLAGLAPRANDSGTLSGYRRTARGRRDIKPILFMAAMAARRSNSRLRTYYEKLVEKGKHKMVALVALMRKILVIANARLKFEGC